LMRVRFLYFQSFTSRESQGSVVFKTTRFNRSRIPPQRIAFSA